MSALTTKILIERVENHHGRKIAHQSYECAAESRDGSKINFHNDLVELTETCERLQMAEDILKKILANQYNSVEGIRHYSGRVFIDSSGRVTPEEFEYLQELARGQH